MPAEIPPRAGTSAMVPPLREAAGCDADREPAGHPSARFVRSSTHRNLPANSHPEIVLATDIDTHDRTPIGVAPVPAPPWLLRCRGPDPGDRNRGRHGHFQPAPGADPAAVAVPGVGPARVRRSRHRGDTGRLTLLEYQDLARDARLFAGWVAYYRSQYNVTGGGPPEDLTSTISTSTLFSVLGVAPLHGDIWPTTEDFTRQYLVTLSHRVWQQRFGGRREVIGSTITLDGAAYRVTGVLPEGFDFPLATDLFRISAADCSLLVGHWLTRAVHAAMAIFARYSS